MRKIISMVYVPKFIKGESVLVIYAACDDGTFWTRTEDANGNAGPWEKDAQQIPQE